MGAPDPLPCVRCVGGAGAEAGGAPHHRPGSARRYRPRSPYRRHPRSRQRHPRTGLRRRPRWRGSRSLRRLPPGDRPAPRSHEVQRRGSTLRSQDSCRWRPRSVTTAGKRLVDEVTSTWDREVVWLTATRELKVQSGQPPSSPAALFRRPLDAGLSSRPIAGCSASIQPEARRTCREGCSRWSRSRRSNRRRSPSLGLTPGSRRLGQFRRTP